MINRLQILKKINLFFQKKYERRAAVHEFQFIFSKKVRAVRCSARPPKKMNLFYQKIL